MVKSIWTCRGNVVSVCVLAEGRSSSRGSEMGTAKLIVFSAGCLVRVALRAEERVSVSG